MTEKRDNKTNSCRKLFCWNADPTLCVPLPDLMKWCEWGRTVQLKAQKISPVGYAELTKSYSFRFIIDTLSSNCGRTVPDYFLLSAHLLSQGCVEAL